MIEALVDIIVPVFNEAALTRVCLDSIKRCSDVPYNLILVDNGSGEETRRFLEGLETSDPNVILVRNDTNLGWVKAVNQAMRLSRSPYILFMNNDTIVMTDGWLSGLIAVAKSALDIGLVNPRFDIKNRIETAEPFIEIDFCRGYCVLVKRAVMERIGLLDESYGLGYYDDDDYSVRAIRAGFRCVRANGVYVKHLGDSTFSRIYEEPKRRALHERNKALFYSKWGHRLRLVFAVTKLDAAALADIFLRLARRQHIVYVWGVRLPDAGPAHINVRGAHLPGLLRGSFFTLALFLNRMKSPPKRYDIVFTDDERIKNALSKTGYDIHYIDAGAGEKIDNIVDKASRA